MNSQQTSLQILPTVLESSSPLPTKSFVTLKGLKIETIESFLNRKGKIDYYPKKTNKKSDR